jgi:lipoprotein-anchoring transpeptidase ErfK/SrfK
VRSRPFIIVASLLAVLFLGIGALTAYDQTNKDKIAEGVTVGGVEVGGMTRAQARDEITRDMRQRARQAIVARDGTAHFSLTPRMMGAQFDVDGMIDDAIARSREGNIFSRSYREVRGQPLHDADVPARVTYSKLVLARFIGRVERTLNRKPVDAHLEYTEGTFKRIPGLRGVRVNSRALHTQLEGAITGLAPGTIQVRAVKRDPKVTLAEVAKANPTIVVVDRPNFKLRLYKNLKLVKTYGVAVGASGYDTPAGEYHIEDKTIDPTWYVPNAAWAGSLAGQVIPGGTAANPLKARWLGFGGGRGIHGTAEDSSIGSAASHGCIRMHVPDVEALYPRVPLGAPLYVV